MADFPEGVVLNSPLLSGGVPTTTTTTTTTRRATTTTPTTNTTVEWVGRSRLEPNKHTGHNDLGGDDFELVDLGIGRDTDGVSNILSGGVSFRMHTETRHEQSKHPNVLNSKTCSEMKHNTIIKSPETKHENELKPVYLSKPAVPVKQTFLSVE